MATRDIRTHAPASACDVCGRTLLRGERAEVFLSGGSRRSVCELCKTRALHEGWVREGAVPDFSGAEPGRESGGSFLRRLRSRRERDRRPARRRAPREELELEAPDGYGAQPGWAGAGEDDRPVPDAAFDQELGLEPESTLQPPDSALQPGPDTGGELARDLAGGDLARSPRRPEAPARSGSRRGQAPREQPAPVAARAREPRHVRAVPTSAEQKCFAALELFNGSEHKRTVAGVARSLGAPVVAVRASGEHPSLVHLAISWELCWYRYEVDLADEVPSVRPAGQGYELDDLAPWELDPNAVADERGALLPVS